MAASNNDHTSGYASVNGLNMYYEIHGSGKPLVLLHGALTTIDTSFGKFIPTFAQTRQVIAVEQQAHGHTADIDRPFSYEAMADDTAALLRHLKIEQADFFGYSMGAGVALRVAIQHPDLVGKLVLAAVSYSRDGLYAELYAAMEGMKPEDFIGAPFHDEYIKTAPNPEHWANLVNKNTKMDLEFEGWPSEDVQAIKVPVLLIIGDSDVVRPEHAVEMFRLFGGGVAGDLAGLPQSQLAILPGTTHVTLVDRAEWLLPMISEFLDKEPAAQELHINGTYWPVNDRPQLDTLQPSGVVAATAPQAVCIVHARISPYRGRLYRRT